MDAYVEAGGNFIDTADVYSFWADGNPGGVSEQIIGRWMKERTIAETSCSQLKYAVECGKVPTAKDLSRSHIMQAAEESLRRLDTDYFDLYQIHWDDLETPMEETLRALDDLVSQGKVRYLGCSNISAWRLMKSLCISEKLGLARYDGLQPH